MFNQFVAVSSIFALASSFIFIEIALESLAPLEIAVLRIIGSAVLFLVGIYKNRSRQIMVLKTYLFPIVLMGFLLVVFPNILLNYGIDLISVPSACLIEATEPLCVVVLAMVILGEPFKIRYVAGFLLAAMGSVILASKGFSINPFLDSYWKGFLLVGLSSGCYAFSNIMGKKMLDRLLPVELMAWSFVVGAFIMLPFSLLVDPAFLPNLFSSGIQLNAFMAVLGLICISTIGGYLLYFNALSRLKASQLAYYLFLSPIITLLYSSLFFRARIDFYVWVASFFILAGVFIVKSKFHFSYLSRKIFKMISEM